MLFALVSQCMAEERSDSADAKPNIVFILADDLGWPDVGFNGNTFYQTPNIDRLASTGMIFSNAYSGGPNCAPTRACLMTGMYGPRTNIWTPGARSKGQLKHMKFLVPNKHNKKGDVFKSVESLSPDVISLAEILEPAGYATARFGKWHLGEDTQGFDISSWSGGIEEDYPKQSKGYSDIDNSVTITDAGVRFIEENKDRPFFLYLSHFEVHTPLKADPAVTKKYQQKLKSKAWEENWNPTYAAMIEAVDNSVGRIQEKLEQLGISENTIVIFSSDNGGVGGVTPMKPLRGAKGSLYEGGIRVSTCIRWPKKIAAGTTCETPITSVDFMPTFAELAGGQLPTDQPVDGTSFVPLLSGDTLPPEQSIGTIRFTSPGKTRLRNSSPSRERISCIGEPHLVR